MTDLKRKRSPDDPTSAQTARSPETPYFDGMPDGLAELADVKLLVQGLPSAQLHPEGITGLSGSCFSSQPRQAAGLSSTAP